LTGEPAEPQAIENALAAAGLKAHDVKLSATPQDFRYEAQLVGSATSSSTACRKSSGQAPDRPLRVEGSGPRPASSCATPR